MHRISQRVRASVYILLSLVLIASGAGCSRLAASRKTVALDQIDISKVYAAAYLVPQRASATIPENTYVAFIYADGSFRLVKTKGMEYGKVSWTSKGLFFADKDNDYWLAEGQKPKVVPSSKVDTQDTLGVLQDNITHVGVYNGGFTEDGEGYNEDIVLFDGQKAEKHRFLTDHPVSSISVCGSSVYAYQLTDDGVNLSKELIRFSSLIVDNHYHPRMINTHDNILTSDNVVISNPSCTNDSIVFISSQGGNSSTIKKKHNDLDYDLRRFLTAEDTEGENFSYATIEQWDAKTGNRRVLPLVDEEARPVQFHESQIGYSYYDSHSLHGDQFYWWYGDGGLLRTDVNSGKTVKLNRTHYQKDNWSRSCFWASFSDKTVDVWYHHINEPDRVTITRQDLDTGKTINTIEVKGLEKIIHGAGDSNTIDRSFAVNPRAEKLISGQKV